MYRQDTVKIRDEQRLFKNTLEKILEFMRLSEAIDTYEKPNMRTDDYTLHQFQCRVGRQIERYEPNRVKNFKL